MHRAPKGNDIREGAAVDPRRHLFYETSHSPAVSDLVGYENAKDIIDFCFIANPYYPTPEMLDDLQQNLPNLIKSYPSSNPLMSQKHLAAVLHVDPENLIIGNGATELIALINMTLIDRIAVPVPTFGEYIEKMKDQRDAELYSARSGEADTNCALDDYLAWVHKRKLKCAAGHQSRQSDGAVHSAGRDGRVSAPGARSGAGDCRRVVHRFCRETRFPACCRSPTSFTNLLIVRSMSKHCGVPGLRLGYCYSANLYMLNRLRRFLPTWNLNTLAQYFLVSAAGHRCRVPRGPQAADRRRALALRARCRTIPAARRLSYRREFRALSRSRTA